MRVGGARMLVCCVCVASVGSQDPPPPCQLGTATFARQGYEGGTLFAYPATDPHFSYCRLDSSCAGDICVIPDGEACQVVCEAGYYDDPQNPNQQLHCTKPVPPDHLPDLEYDFSCTGASLTTASPR